MTTMDTSKVFNETAQYYSIFRPDYPEEMVNLVMKELGEKTSERMLDLGCGTGKVALVFYKHFNEIIAADINDEMIQEAVRVSETSQINNIKWLVKSAEEIDESYGKFDLITFGSSLHWMDMDKVLKTSYKMLNKNGIIAMLGFGRGFSREESEWKAAVSDTIEKWIDQEKVKDLPNVSKDDIEQVLNQLQFSSIKEDRTIYKETIDIDTIIGYLYTTSFCSKNLLGKNVENFEEDLRNTLYKINTEGLFEGNLGCYYKLCKK